LESQEGAVGEVDQHGKGFAVGGAGERHGKGFAVGGAGERHGKGLLWAAQVGLEGGWEGA
jgi:hypothetical protein